MPAAFLKVKIIILAIYENIIMAEWAFVLHKIGGWDKERLI